MKIIFLDYMTLSFKLDLSPLSQLGQLIVYDNTTDEDVARVIADADVIITNQNNLNEANLHDAKALKLICAAATGYNNIDVAYCRTRGIAVTNVPGYATASVAQHTFAMLFHLISHSVYYEDFVKSGCYSSGSLYQHNDCDFFELEGKTWGIIGLGAIGRKVGQYARGFGCKVIYYSPSGSDREEEFRRVDLEYLLHISDVISIHAPLTVKTVGLIGLKELKQMKRGSYLLNLGRGGIIDENDLITALENKWIAGAGLDVFETEPPLPDTKIIKYASNRKTGGKLYLTPHIGYAGLEARERLILTVRDNIKAFCEGNLLNRLDC